MEIKPIKKPISRNPFLWTILAVIMMAVVIYVSYYFYTNTPVIDDGLIIRLF